MADNTDIVQQILSHLQSLKQPDYGTVGALGGAIGAYTNGNQVADAYGQSASDAQSQADALKSQMDAMPTLATMYGPDSSYAKQLQMQLAAKDAAAGRNSQYGPRLQALQANLADKGSQYAQQQATMAQAYTNARNTANTQRLNATNGQAQVRAQQLGSLFNLGDKSGVLGAVNTGLGNMAQPYINSIKTGLGNMFPSWNGSGVTQQPMDQSPYAGGGSYSGYTTGSDQNNMGTQPYQSNGGMGQMYGPGNDYVNPDNQQTYNQAPTQDQLTDY